MQFIAGHTGFGNESEGALTVAIRAMQCNNNIAALATACLNATPMSQRNDAYTTIYFYRYC